MLSAETATGKNPIPSVEVMAKIIQCVEKDQKYFDCPFDEMCKFPSLKKEEEKRQSKIEDSALALGKAVKQLVMALNIKAIACFTYSGYSAMAISNSRPKVPIYALTPNEYVAKQCALYWGVQAIKLPEVQSIEDMLLTVEKTLIENSLVKRGDMLLL
jgi:pyruvate kinase